MAEPINLAPVRVHAISVTVQPPPNSIVGPAEMFLQQGENGGVQIDVFWRDAMGNEIHESKEMQEEEYEALRARYLHSEQASLPSFSSFKSGNTLGRVVGETAPAAVPASQANPPIEAETEEEGITGKQILDGIQLGLDVVGLIPVVGEVADIASGVISLFRGDYVGAGLSLLSAIPFVGYLGTAGKATRYSRKMAEASGKATKELAEEAAEKTAQEAAEKGAKSTSEASGAKILKREKSLRERYLGRTPGKDSRTGKEVQERMRSEDKLRDGKNGTEFEASDGEWYPLKDADMAHNKDAVKWWNEEGRLLGEKSPEVRKWMLDSKNYTLDHYSINRSAGAKLGETYLPPLK